MARRRKYRRSPLGGLLRTTTLAAGGWIAYSHLGIDHQVPLPEALSADRDIVRGERAGQLSYYHDRQAEGRPLVLLHSINAAASAYEMEPLFTHFRPRRPVYALDLPGYGFSDRSERVYSPALFEGAILDFLEALNTGPADVVALSLSSEFAARAALINPELFASLALISPTGFRESRPAEFDRFLEQKEGSDNYFHRLLTVPVWKRPAYDLLTTNASIRYFLQKSFVGPVPQDMIDYAFATAHQKGAENAPFYFLSGQLFTEGIRPAIYERLELPVLVIYDQDAYTTFATLPEVVESHSNWLAARIQPTRGLPHFEKLLETAEALEKFWASA